MSADITAAFSRFPAAFMPTFLLSLQRPAGPPELTRVEPTLPVCYGTAAFWQPVRNASAGWLCASEPVESGSFFCQWGGGGGLSLTLQR